MARSKDWGLDSPGWIHELARAEIHPDAERLLNLKTSHDPQQLVEENTIEFLSLCREVCSDYARVFNALSESGKKFSEVKVYQIANSPADFMIFRNSIKLMFTNPAHGIIQIKFTQHSRLPIASAGVNEGSVQEINANVGPFRDVFWTFGSERVSPDQIVKFYFTEFVRLTRDSKKSRFGNQVLLDQIKALLDEKGLQLE